MSTLNDAIIDVLTTPGQFTTLVPEISQFTNSAKGSNYETQTTLKVKITPSIPVELPLHADYISHLELPHLFNGSLFCCVFFIAPADKRQGSTNSTTLEDPYYDKYHFCTYIRVSSAPGSCH
jgi:hypothetical protein